MFFIPIYYEEPVQCTVNQCVYYKSKSIEKIIREKKMTSYGLGCEGPRNGCSIGRYDCSGIITSVLREAGLWSGKKLTTETFGEIGNSVPINQTKYGDFIIMKPDKNYNNSKHLAFVLEGRDGKGVTILDWFPDKKFANARFIGGGRIEKVIRIK